MPPPASAGYYHYSGSGQGGFTMPPGPSPPRQSAIPTSVIQAAATSSHDDLYFLELGFQQRVKKKVRRVKSEATPGTGAKRKSREGEWTKD